MLKASALYIGVIVCFSAQVVAQDQPLAELSLEELLNVQVSSVSRRLESAIWAPGTVTVLSAEHLQDLQVNTLHEALQTVPGIFITETYFSLSSDVGIRGSLSSGGNNKTLFLINGHPIFHPIDSTFFPDLVPIQAIDRVEIIRGPVSVMYGTNAYTGVINVITKTQTSRPIVAELIAGSFGRQMLSLNASHQWNNGQFFIAGHLRNEDGWAMDIEPGQDFIAEEAQTRNQLDEHQQLLVWVRQGHFEFNALRFDQEKSAKYGILPTLIFQNIGPFDNRVEALNLKHHWEFNAQTTLHSMLRYDKSSYYYAVDNYQILQGEPEAIRRIGTGYWGGNRRGLELFLDTNKPTWSLTTGLVVEKLHGSPVVFETGVSDPFVLIERESNSTDWATYANAAYKPDEETRWILGIRHTEDDESGGHFDYRLGYIREWNALWHIKLLYGTAFRAPQFDELYQNAPPVILGDPELKPEVLDGFDASLLYANTRFSAEITGFWNRTDREIRAVPNTDEIPMYTNLKGREGAGLEWDLSWHVPHFKTYFRGSRLFTSKDRASNESNLKQTIATVIAAGLTWQFHPEFVLNVHGIYNGAWLESDAYDLWNGGVRWIPAFANGRMELFARSHNLTDERYTYAEPGGLVPTIPGGPPRQNEIGLRLKW
ncbi:MAG: TonB-dependent receptor [Acidobacteria bacterium]|nr:TonB-dependent receptor [Acidobacteriota bacterium]